MQTESLMNKRHGVSHYLITGCLVLLTFAMLLPLWHVLVISLSTPKSYAMDSIHLWPYAIDLAQYSRVFTNNDIMRSFRISVGVTIVGTILSMTLSILGAYALSKKNLPGRKVFLTMIILTMFFNGGLVPYYLLVRMLGLSNTYYALVLPVAINSFNLIVLKNHFLAFPSSLEESTSLNWHTALSR